MRTSISAERPPVAAGGDAAINATGVRKEFGSTVAVAGLDLRIEAGEIFGLVGPDGAGKTTTFRLLLGLLKPDAGEISLAGHDVRRTPQAARAVTGYVAQQFSLYCDLSVADDIRFSLDIRGIHWRSYA